MSLTDSTLDGLGPESCTRARQLVDDAQALRTRRERATRQRFVRLFRDDRALGVTIALTDEVMRYSSVASATRTLRASARQASVRGFGLVNALGLRAIALASNVAPFTVVHVVHARIRRLSSDLILNADVQPLRRHVKRRRGQGLALNINVLGEAVLGEREAQDRFERVVEMMQRPDVQYVSVKLSAVVSQLVTIDVDGSRERVAQRLRALYRMSQQCATFVNLDMEEYRDLRLTVEAFRTVLAEPEFSELAAGIVLQAYLPEAHGVLDDLLTWALERYQQSGGRIKIRLVKGANLAMETAEAQLHGWCAAPYATKADVDASYARLLDVSLRAQWAPAVRIGVASHNLFHLSWALDVARARGVQDQLDVEMLEGMANAEALAIARSGQPVLLYVPVTRENDFAAAVAYLVRRLDENTSAENYLRAAFFIREDPDAFGEQRERFLRSLEHRHGVSVRSRRHSLRPIAGAPFENCPDGDPTDERYVEAVAGALATVRATNELVLDAFADREETSSDDYVDGHDPSSNGEVWYRYAVATAASVDAAVRRAHDAHPLWSAVAPDERRDLLFQVSEVMAERRTATIAVMARDAGKTAGEADVEVSEAIDFVRFYALGARDLEGSSPLGVVLVVPPWNFPYAIPTGGVASALAAGNVVLLKPAPETVATAWTLAQQFWDGGVGRDVLQVVTTRDDEVGRHLVTHDGVDAVILTGSFDTAALFTSWKPGLHLLGETSGKNAIVVTACADLDLAVKDLVQSAFGHAGQKCSAASLAMVEQSVYDGPIFLRQLRDAVQSLSVGPATQLATTMGPVVHPPDGALERALTQLDGEESWLVAPTRIDDGGYLWRPGVKIGVREGSWSHHHEWFGPVLAVMPVADLATAIAWQNQIAYGLTAGLHSLDESECAQWIDQVEAGNLYVNRGITGAVVWRQPFGGWKRSSVGPTAKAGGSHYLHGLRAWPPVADLDEALVQLRQWWADEGGRASDPAGLEVECNLQRFRRSALGVAVRIDAQCSARDAAYLRAISAVTGVDIELSGAERVAALGVMTVETAEQLVDRCAEFAKVRWLSGEVPPAAALLERGVTTDRRTLAQAGAVEGPRWVLEQSVAVTNHRYGNTGAGPKVHVRGLAEA